jgi:hypothetical protein
MPPVLRWLLLAVAAASLCACGTAVEVPVEVTSTGDRITCRISARDVRAVTLRAAHAADAAVVPAPASSDIIVTATPQGGAMGYHPPASEEPWRETPADEWGLAFKARRYGGRLVISSFNEIAYIHHRYALRDIRLTSALPRRAIRLQSRKLSGDGAADLRR